MKKILYSPNALEKLQEIKWNIRVKYGVQISNRIIKNILSAIKELRTYENKGVSVARMTGIPCEYRMIFAEHNYVFYKIEKTAILIIDIYNEKEDFMWKLFGIKTISDEIEDYKDTTGKSSTVNLNTATLEELTSLPGIGESTAQKIIDYRKQNGKFKVIEDLKNVSGIGESKFDNIKDKITVR